MIVVLGNTNDEDGNLSAVATSRCDKAIELWLLDKSQHIITTGTFGAHFNTSQQTHSYWLKQYLIGNKVAPNKILPNIISVTTFQDILGLRKELLERKEKTVDIITSDFHYGRVKFYCDLILHDLETDSLLPNPDKVKIYGVPSPITADEKEKLVAYEKHRMETIMEFPSVVYENASLEQKHYDTVSNWMITGQFTTFALGYKFIRDSFKHNHNLKGWDDCIRIVDPYIKGTFLQPHYLGWWEVLIDKLDRLLYVLPLFFAITFFWMLYIRAAQTARTARQTLRNIERCYSQFGFSLYYHSGRLKKFYFTFKRILECIYLILSVLLFKEVSIFLSIIFLAFYFVKFYKKNDR